jgi:hypothetical protein
MDGKTSVAMLAKCIGSDGEAAGVRGKFSDDRCLGNSIYQETLSRTMGHNVQPSTSNVERLESGA